MDKKLVYKKNLLIRKNKSKLYLDNYRHKILELFKISPDEIYFLTLEESDAIRKHSFNNSGIVNIRYENAEIDIRKSILKIIRGLGMYYGDRQPVFDRCFYSIYK